MNAAVEGGGGQDVVLQMAAPCPRSLVSAWGFQALQEGDSEVGCSGAGWAQQLRFGSIWGPGELARPWSPAASRHAACCVARCRAPSAASLMLPAACCRSSYWIFAVAPQALRVIAEQTAQELSLLNAGLPILRPFNRARPQFSAPERWILRQFGWQPHDFLPEQFAVCAADVNQNTLQPADTVTCSLHDLALTAAGQHSDGGSFEVRPDSTAATTAPAAVAGTRGARSSARAAAQAHPAAGRCPHAGPGLVLGPAGRWLSRAASQWRPAAVGMRVLSQLWTVMVPTGSFVKPQCGLFSQLHLLAYDRPFNALCVQTLGGRCWEVDGLVEGGPALGVYDSQL